MIRKEQRMKEKPKYRKAFFKNIDMLFYISAPVFFALFVIILFGSVVLVKKWESAEILGVILVICVASLLPFLAFLEGKIFYKLSFYEDRIEFHNLFGKKTKTIQINQIERVTIHRELYGMAFMFLRVLFLKKRH